MELSGAVGFRLQYVVMHTGGNMPSCEKCWNDAFWMSYIDPDKTQAEYYTEIIKERKDSPCTPEQQAGPDAEECPKCKRKCLHQCTHDCMNPECV